MDDGRLSGPVRRWTCGSSLVLEATLGDGDGRNLLVQVVEPVGGDEAATVLDSVRVGS